MRNAGGKVTIYTQKQTFSELAAIAVPHPPLRGTFPPGEGIIGKINSNLRHYRSQGDGDFLILPEDGKLQGAFSGQRVQLLRKVCLAGNGLTVHSN